MNLRLPLLLVLCLAVTSSARAADDPALDPATVASGVATTKTLPRGRYVIGLSPFLKTDSKDPVFQNLVRFLLEDLPLGSSLWIYDAYQQRSITHVVIPELRAFGSSKTRATQFKAPILELRRFLAATPTPPTHAGAPFTGALRVPQFLDFIADNRASDGAPVAILLLGSPLHLDDKEPAFSMVDGYFPSDGHLRVARDRSIYGIQDRARALPEVAVYWAYFGDPWISDLHRERVGRFWSLFVQGQGGHLASFTGDLSTAFHGLTQAPVNAGPAAPRHSLDPNLTKVEMLRITREVAATDWITGDLPDHHRPPPPTITKGPLKIGIRWRGHLDLDLYARANPRATTLCFEQTRSPEGYYAKDHRSSPDHDYEFIEFTEPVDVRTVEASVNFYQGELPGSPEGEVRVEFQNRIYAGRFTIPAHSGNLGRGGAEQGEFWAPLNLPALLGLP